MAIFQRSKQLLAGKFPLTTLDRLLSTPAVRKAIGFELVDNKLKTELPAEEAMKPLRRIVIDLAEKRKTVTDLKSKDQQIAYVNEFKSADKPNFAKKTGKLEPIEKFTQRDFAVKTAAPVKKATPQRSVPRTTVVPRTCKLNVSKNPKIAELYTELRSLQLAKHPHAIAVLLRVFLEISIDVYLTNAGIPLTFSTPGGDEPQTLRKEVEQAVDHMVNAGAAKKDFLGVTRALSDTHHPFNPEILHAYVHNSFYTPVERDLRADWDNGQPLFERIWQ